MNTANSPAPWTVIYDDGWTVQSPPVGEDVNFSVRVVVDLFHRGEGKQVCADAHLIAAAPDLLKSCKELTALIPQQLIVADAATFTAAIAAIAKAEEGKK